MKAIKNQNLINQNSLFSKEIINNSNKISVTNPATDEIIGEIPYFDEQQIKKSLDTTVNNMDVWSSFLPKERQRILNSWYYKVIENIDDLAAIVTCEQGKTLQDAKAEIIYGANFILWFASEAIRINGDITNGIKPNQKIITLYEPVGPVAAITPWNFPNAMIARKLAPALAAGCSVILKPSELTPFSAFALVNLAIESGVPEGVINIVTGDPEKIGQVICADPRIRKLTFTGSTRVGRILYQRSAANFKKVSLELGGNAPMIVFDDINIDKVIDDIINAKIRNAGQACTSINRLFVHNSISKEFIDKLTAKFSNLKVGDGMDHKTDIGPLINQQAVSKIIYLLNDAVQHGGKIICGGNLIEQNKLFFSPTIVTGANLDSAIFHEEIFGPVINICVFHDDEELIKMANDCNYGLASYFYTNNHQRIWNLVKSLNYGMVGVNESLVSNEIGAFAGRKDSGIGIEGSKLGIYEFLNTKYILMS